jgi:hypothetical protein
MDAAGATPAAARRSALRPPLPRVSFIVPMHNAGADLEPALRSMLVDQTYAGHVEVSIYDDCSTDGSAETVRTWQAALAEAHNGRGGDGGAAAAAAAAAGGASSSAAAATTTSPSLAALLALAPGPRSLVLTTPGDVGATLPCGPGFGRNRATEASTGEWLFTADADDESLPDRVDAQLAHALARPDGGAGAIIGAGFVRLPADSTPTYTAWANSLDDRQVSLQQWRECTIVHPTWAMRRATYDAVGGYDEKPPPAFDTGRAAAVEDSREGGGGGAVTASSSSAAVAPAAAPPAAAAHPAARYGNHGVNNLIYQLPNVVSEGRADGGDSDDDDAEGGGVGFDASTLPRHAPILGARPPRLTVAERTGARVFAAFPEDMLFIQRHLGAGGTLTRVPRPLLAYRYSPVSQSFKIPRQFLLRLRVALWEERLQAVDPAWRRFVIWGAGRDGKAFYNALSPAGRAAVAAFAEVDANKVGEKYPAPLKGAKKRARAAQGAAARAANDAAAAAAAAEAAAAAAAASHDTGGSSASAAIIDGDAVGAACGHKRGRPDDADVASETDGATHGGDSGAGAMPAGQLAPPQLLPPPPTRGPGPRPIVHYLDLPRLPGGRGPLPVVVCVYLTSGGDELRANVAAAAAAAGGPLCEGVNLWYFV